LATGQSVAECCIAALTGLDEALYIMAQTYCFDGTGTISTTDDLAPRLDAALKRIELAMAARAAAAAEAARRHDALKAAASEAVVALDALVGDT
jgi:hypothetical protein